METMELTYRDYHNKVFSPLDLKEMELDVLKRDANRHLGRLNGLKMRYMDWFSRRQNSFLESLKLIHLLAAQLLPREVNTISHYRKVINIANKFPRNGTPRDGSSSKMEEFLMFWDEWYMLKLENDSLYARVCEFCKSVRRLRQQVLKDEIDRLHYRLNLTCSEDFDFTHIGNDRNNLFTYKVALHDHKYHGLVSFIPYLISYATKLCYWTSKLHIEVL
ncbi:uncharacterized protein LOC127716504 [Mytilus californianus]|uniref:Uncharacterized protein n=1 Tax=Mytilus coruscus TaxID=42192 RepID=A0A6J8D6S2_MYTCO|nr:uncharacterized protein LOC127716504 [Mytilus californianus]XP_052078707.1 uncharacterized protein LOC127716504 [Mytilus californianus]XP_052078708.1 uncharacterized protein LOC127716504 [Mytilus californianus]XP_052078709.1 uncharacterized protein LOC127716504 [Mytilus californianus]CAC5403341.1 unnamed protein product [Mytilus coruscus]